MKQKIYVKIAAIAMIGLMISCSTSNEVASKRGIQKRKYTKGYFFDFNKKLGGLDKADQVAQNDSDVIEPVIEEATAVREVPETIVHSVATTDKNVELAEIVKTTVNENAVNTNFASPSEDNKVDGVDKLVFEESTKNDIKIIKSDVKFLKKQFRHKKHAVQSSDSSDDAILYYILCFFIPWLAVGLVTNWDMRTVVINLLWSLLCGIPGIIHALIVVSRNV